jgi:hypothetical protein
MSDWPVFVQDGRFLSKLLGRLAYAPPGASAACLPIHNRQAGDEADHVRLSKSLAPVQFLLWMRTGVWTRLVSLDFTVSLN